MQKPRYLFVGDQGRVFASSRPPTEELFAYAAVGMVTIVRTDDFHYYGSDRSWRRIEIKPIKIKGT